MIRFLLACAISAFLFFVGVALLPFCAEKVIEIWRRGGFFDYPHAIMAGFLLLGLSWGLAIEIPKLLFFTKPKKLTPTTLFWGFGIMLALTLLSALFGPTSTVGVVLWTIVCIGGYWAASEPFDMTAIAAQARVSSGLVSIALAILGVASLCLGFLNYPSAYSGRRFIELAEVYGKAPSAVEREFVFAAGALTVGAVMLSVALALTIWLIATRRR